MNIALIGHGNMGKEIERMTSLRRHSIKQIFTSRNNADGKGLTKQSLNDIDVCIDFSTSMAAMNNIEAAAKCGKNIVVGTTGWYDRLKEVEKLVKEKKVGLVYSPNFSLGMNIFFQILNSTAHYFDKFDDYDVALQEVHHRGKADSPSGTTLIIGQILLQHIRRKKELLHETSHRQISKQQLHVTSTRVGAVVGRHSVLFDSEADSIELVHTAKNRSGFAAGVLIAAEWLKGKKGVYTMKDIFTSL